MKILAIYDNGGKTVDRYSVVTNILNTGKMYDMLGVSQDPSVFSQWTTGQYDINNVMMNKHLGKLVRFEKLTEELQRHIAERILL